MNIVITKNRYDRRVLKVEQEKVMRALTIIDNSNYTVIKVY